MHEIFMGYALDWPEICMRYSWDMPWICLGWPEVCMKYTWLLLGISELLHENGNSKNWKIWRLSEINDTYWNRFHRWKAKLQSILKITWCCSGDNFSNIEVEAQSSILYTKARYFNHKCLILFNNLIKRKDAVLKNV